MENTAITWCHHTFNGWEGCTKVSPGCAHCYAETRNARFNRGTASNWGPGAPRRRTSPKTWGKVRKWNHEAQALRQAWEERLAWAEAHGDAFDEPAPERPRVFVSSLSDWLDPEVSLEWLLDLLHVVYSNRHLDFLLLTKRPGLWRERLEQALHWQAKHDPLDAQRPGMYAFLANWLGEMGGPTSFRPPNVWAMTSVEDQPRAEERIPALLEIPAVVHGLSCEPLLGALNLRHVSWIHSGGRTIIDALTGHMSHAIDGYRPVWPRIDWVIVGGESGHCARPMQPDWARSLRDQCAATGVAFHFKQWGEWAPQPEATAPYFDGLDVPPRLLRAGKHAAGRLLDGVEHHAFPRVQ